MIFIDIAAQFGNVDCLSMLLTHAAGKSTVNLGDANGYEDFLCNLINLFFAEFNSAEFIENFNINIFKI